MKLKFLNPNKTFDVIENKKKALKLKEKGNDAFKRKKYEVAEKFYSEALRFNQASRPLWTNRAICRNTMKKHEDALADCLSALSIDSKCPKSGFQIDTSAIDFEHQFEIFFESILQKGNAHLALDQFDEAKECFETLRSLGENSVADQYLKKLNDAQERDLYSFLVTIYEITRITL